MRILILGGEGMLGHKVFQKLQLRFDTYVTFRDTNGLWLHHPAYNGIDRSHTLGGVNALDIDGLEQRHSQGQARWGD